jgi:hypothetical protein
MSGVAASALGPIRSPASHAPRASATSGLTYAWVDARLGDTVRASQAKQVNPSTEPNPTR